MSRYWTSLKDLYIEDLVKQSVEIEKVASEFQIKISPTIQMQLQNRNSEDVKALLGQFVPSILEATILPEELDDPIGDHRFMPVAGVVHRYQDRALLKITQLCEVYCRFCFRKEMIGHKGEMLTPEEIDAAIDYFSVTKRLKEVILTGGDPLILSVRRMSDILERIAAISHIKSIRIHSRIPIVSPKLITTQYLSLFEKIIDSRKVSLVLVVHANHAAEFTEEAEKVLLALRKRGVLLLSQSVMLKNINDNEQALTDLMWKFIENGVKPYYLHQMDLARGTSHFVVENERAIELVNSLREKNSGICVPRLILEIPAGGGKKVLA